MRRVVCEQCGATEYHDDGETTDYRLPRLFSGWKVQVRAGRYMCRDHESCLARRLAQLQAENADLRRRVEGLKRAEEMWITRIETAENRDSWRAWFACLAVVRGEAAVDWKPPAGFEPEMRGEGGER